MNRRNDGNRSPLATPDDDAWIDARFPLAFPSRNKVRRERQNAGTRLEIRYKYLGAELI